MTILNYGNLIINSKSVSYEAVEITSGSITRKPNPQINGKNIFTTDVTSNYSTIKITQRVSPASNELFDQIYNNGDNNTITYRSQNFSNCSMEVLPARKDQDTVDYMIFGDPAV